MKFYGIRIILFALSFLAVSYAQGGVIDDKRENEILREFLWQEFVSLPKDKRP